VRFVLVRRSCSRRWSRASFTRDGAVAGLLLLA
jgi:hypothetical protein